MMASLHLLTPHMDPSQTQAATVAPYSAGMCRPYCDKDLIEQYLKRIH